MGAQLSRRALCGRTRILVLGIGILIGLGAALLIGGGNTSAHLDPNDPSHHQLAQSNGGLICQANGSCTHGPDPAPEGLDPTQPQSPAVISSADEMKAVCDGDGVSSKRVQVIYIYRTGTADNFNQFRDSIRAWTVQSDKIFRTSAAKTGGQRYVRFVHDATCTISVLKVRLDSALDYYSYYQINTELANRGYNRSDRIYLAYVDYQASQAVCGWGNFRTDDSPGTNNLSATGSYSDYATIAVTYRGCWEDAMVGAHELGHTFGAVQPSAPNSTPNSHCTDEWDVMCYEDGPGVSVTYECGEYTDFDDYYLYNYLFDCNNDDYFHTNPPVGNYLKTHWNVANSPFLGRSLATMTFDKTSSKYNGVVTVSLSGFTPDYYINIKWPDGTVIAQAKAGAGGTATTTFKTPLSPLGDYPVRASTSAGDSATAFLRVIPRILLNETSGEAGDAIRVYFYGFAPGDQVEVRFYNEAETSSVKLTTITIASNGRGSKIVTIPTSTTVGDHKIVGKVIGVSRSASTYFEVTGLGSADDPTPTATPTEAATETATPTETPQPSETAIPTPELTGTPEPTIEVGPTETPTAEIPTETPVPVDTETPTPEPTPSEMPTETPLPIDTPVPTEEIVWIRPIGTV